MTDQVLIYTSPDNHAEVSVWFQGETLWLTQAQMSELFDKDVRTINDHLKNIFAEWELDTGATIRNFRIVRVVNLINK